MSHKTKLVYVELNDKGRVSRIFKGYPLVKDKVERLSQMTRTKAIANVRKQIFIRANGGCEFCAAVITEQTGHMHEKVFRSHGGLISVDNSVAVCYPCHRGEHGLGRGVV